MASASSAINLTLAAAKLLPAIRQEHNKRKPRTPYSIIPSGAYASGVAFAAAIERAVLQGDSLPPRSTTGRNTQRGQQVQLYPCERRADRIIARRSSHAARVQRAEADHQRRE